MNTCHRILYFGLVALAAFLTSCAHQPENKISQNSDATLTMHLFNLHSVNPKITTEECKAAYQNQWDVPMLAHPTPETTLQFGSVTLYDFAETEKSAGHGLLLVEGYSKESAQYFNKPFKGTLYWIGTRTQAGGKDEGGAFSDGWCAGNYTVKTNGKN